MIRNTLNIVMWTLTGVIGALTLASAYSGAIEPSMSLTGRVAPLANMAFPAMVILLALIAVVSALLHCRAWIGAIAVALICAPSILNFAPVNTGTRKPQQGSRTFTLLTYNVMEAKDWGDSTRTPGSGNRVLDYIIRTDPDIVCLQEISALPRTGFRGTTDAQRDSLMTRYPWRQHSWPGGLFFMSKYPMKVLPMPSVKKRNEIFFYGMTVDIDSTQVAIVNVHLQPIGLKMEDKDAFEGLTEGRSMRSDLRELRKSTLGKLGLAFRHRADQTMDIIADTDTLGWPVIVCGDFNDVPLCYSLRLLKKAGFSEVYPQVHCGPAITYHANRFYFRIDHVLWRGDALRPLSLSIGHTDASDHSPVTVTFELNPHPRP